MTWQFDDTVKGSETSGVLGFDLGTLGVDPW